MCSPGDDGEGVWDDGEGVWVGVCVGVFVCRCV